MFSSGMESNCTYFPGKLWSLVQDQQIGSIGWDTSGEGILVHQEQFETEVLSLNCLSQPRQGIEYFRTTNFVSFVRQLNLYGFKKNRTEQQPNIFNKGQMHHFYNPFFKRDKPELLLKIKRLTHLNRAKQAGIMVSTRKSKSFHPVMLNSPQEPSALMRTGSVLLGHQGTPYHHPCNGPQQKKECNRPSESTQSFAAGHVDPCPVPLNTDNVVLVPVSHHFPLGSPSAHPLSVRHIWQDVMPHHSQHGFYPPVNQCCTPDFLDSDLPRFQQPAVSNSGRYDSLMDQDPYWSAGDVPESRTSDKNEKEELDAVLKVAEELQADEDFWRLLQQSIAL